MDQSGCDDSRWILDRLPSKTPLVDRKIAVLVMSDRASDGTYEDESGQYLVDALSTEGADVCAYQVIPDDYELIQKTVMEVSETHDPHVILCTGGTGPGPRDVTPWPWLNTLIPNYRVWVSGCGQKVRSIQRPRGYRGWVEGLSVVR